MKTLVLSGCWKDDPDYEYDSDEYNDLSDDLKTEGPLTFPSQIEPPLSLNLALDPVSKGIRPLGK